MTSPVPTPLTLLPDRLEVLLAEHTRAAHDLTALGQVDGRETNQQWGGTVRYWVRWRLGHFRGEQVVDPVSVPAAPN